MFINKKEKTPQTIDYDVAMQQVSRNMLTAISINWKRFYSTRKCCLTKKVLRAYNESLSVLQTENYLPAIMTTQGTAISIKNIFHLTSKYKNLSQFLAKKEQSPPPL